ncbi:MAG: alpha/beta hydrolase [Actinobacteria bacterium]|nr:alpha/beta hydrolase [Actinomycetota bacterium]
MTGSVAAMIPMTFDGAGGLRLAADGRGPSGARPVLLLHGGGQTRHSWGGTATALAARGWRSITVDLRGHGDSEWSPEGDYQLVRFAEDIDAVAGALPERPFLIGASLGGLTSMLLAGELNPGVAAGIVLVDIIPEMESSGAMRISEFMTAKSRDGFASLEEVAEAVAAYNPHRPRPGDLTGLRKNVRERDGRWYWHWDPAFGGGGEGISPHEVTDTDRLHRAIDRIVADGVPLMLVRGRVSDLVSAEGAERFCRRFPSVEFVDVSDAGHMVAGDRNDAFTDAVVDFLSRVG